jgi:hypothetical protein
MESVDEVLRKIGATDSLSEEPIDADDLVMDWMVTSYLMDSTVADADIRTRYRTLPGERPKLFLAVQWIGEPEVSQYSADYSDSCGGYTAFEGSAMASCSVDPIQKYNLGHKEMSRTWTDPGIRFQPHGGPSTPNVLDLVRLGRIRLCVPGGLRGWRCVGSPDNLPVHPRIHRKRARVEICGVTSGGYRSWSISLCRQESLVTLVCDRHSRKW